MSENQAHIPLISVRLMTYNHEDFIEDALKGIDMQQVSFLFEVVIGDDFSKDNNLERIKNFHFTNPNLSVNILDRPKDGAYAKKRKAKGRMYNFVNILEHCRGDYIALLDGDDYWTDPLKLQKQVEFLQKNPRAIGCFHNSVCVNALNEVINNKYFNGNKKWYNQEQALKALKSSYATAALVFRRAAITNYLEIFTKVGSDFMLDIFITEHGELYYMDENMSAYRIHEGGIWQGRNLQHNNKVLLQRYLHLYAIDQYRTRYNDFLWQIILEFYEELIKYETDNSEIQKLKKDRLRFLDVREKRARDYASKNQLTWYYRLISKLKRKYIKYIK